MSVQQRYCFVAMPFRPELNFFFLYVKHYLEKEYGLRVERGDAKILTKPLMEKIREQILRADLVIGEVTDGNPNVFYELGLAHANHKPVLFLTRGSPDEAPVDIRQFEFIRYDLGDHEDFLGKLNNAIHNFFGAGYEGLFQQAQDLLRRFNAETGLSCSPQRFEVFQALVMRGEQTGGIPLPDTADLFAQFLLPKIILDFTEPRVFHGYAAWIARLAHRENG